MKWIYYDGWRTFIGPIIGFIAGALLCVFSIKYDFIDSNFILSLGGKSYPPWFVLIITIIFAPVLGTIVAGIIGAIIVLIAIPIEWFVKKAIEIFTKVGAGFMKKAIDISMKVGAGFMCLGLIYGVMCVFIAATYFFTNGSLPTLIIFHAGIIICTTILGFLIHHQIVLSSRLGK